MLTHHNEKTIWGLGNECLSFSIRVFAISLTSEDSMVQTSKANRMKILMIIFIDDRNININTPPTFLDEGYQV